MIVMIKEYGCVATSGCNEDAAEQSSGSVMNISGEYCIIGFIRSIRESSAYVSALFVTVCICL